MRATSNVVVFSSLLIASVAIAGPDQKTPAKTPVAKDAPKDAAPKDAPAPTPPTGNTPVQNVDPATVKPEDMPTSVRQRRLEQGTQALKERAWQLKARVQMLKEQMLGGGVGAQAVITHANDMGSAFHLTSLVYSLDGTQVLDRNENTSPDLYKVKSIDVFTGPISPGNHNVSAVAVYRGHGYGLFEYMSKYTFTAKGTNQFTTDEGKISRVECKGYEKGNANTPMQNKPAIDCKVTQQAPEKPAGVPAPAPAAAPAAPTGK
jgi:hypothetical protein